MYTVELCRLAVDMKYWSGESSKVCFAGRSCIHTFCRDPCDLSQAQAAFARAGQPGRSDPVAGLRCSSTRNGWSRHGFKSGAGRRHAPAVDECRGHPTPASRPGARCAQTQATDGKRYCRSRPNAGSCWSSDAPRDRTGSRQPLRNKLSGREQEKLEQALELLRAPR